MKKAILMIGNPLRGDDGITTYLGSLMEEKGSDWQIFYGEDTPEHQFGNIRKYGPDLLVIADAMTGMDVGRVEVIDISDEREYMYSTHNLPMPVLLSYLRGFCKIVLFLGLNVDINNVLDVNPELSEGAKQTAVSGLEKIEEIEQIFNN